MRVKAGITAVIALAAVFASFLMAILLLNLPLIQRLAMKTLEPVLPWTITWDKLTIEVIGGDLTIQGLKAQGKDGRFSLAVDEATTKIRLWHLLRGKVLASPLHATRCTIRQVHPPERKQRDLKAVGHKFQELTGSLILSRFEIRDGTIGPFSFEVQGRYTYRFERAHFSVAASLLAESRSEATITDFALELPNGGRLRGSALDFTGAFDPGRYLSSSDEVFLQGILSLKEGRWGTTRLGDLEVDAALSHDRLKINRFESVLADGTLSLSGALEGLNAAVSPFSGQATYRHEGRLATPIALEWKGEIAASQVTVQALTARSGPAVLTVDGTIQRPGGRLHGNVAVKDFDTRLLFAKWPDGFLKSFGAVAAAQGTISGTVQDPSLTLEVGVTQAHYSLFQAADGKGTLTYAGRKLRFESVGETGLQEPLQVTGTIDFSSRPMRIDPIVIEAKAHPLEKIAPSLKQTGVLTGRFTLRGPTDAMAGEGNLTATDLRFGPVAAATLTAGMKLAGDLLTFTDIRADPPILERSGPGGSLQVDFQAHDVAVLKGQPAEGVSGVARYFHESKLFKMDDLKLQSPYGILAVTGEIGSGGVLNLDARGLLDLQDLSWLDWFRAGEGSAKLSLKIRGTAAAPAPEGMVEWHGKMLTLTEPGITLGPLAGTIRLSPRGYTLDGLDVGIHDGRLTASGTIQAAALKPQILDLALSATNFPMARADELRLLVDGDFRVVGPLANFLLSGRVRLVEGRYTRDFKITELLLKPLTRDAPKEASEWHGFGATRLDIAIEQTGDVEVKNNIADISLKTDLALKGTLSHPRLEGSIQTVEGKIYYLGSTFNILSGRIDFTDPARINPEVDIRAEKTLSAAQGPIRSLEITFTGRLDNLKLVLPSNVDRRDFFNLLAFGYTEDELRRAGIDRGSYVASGLALGEVSRSFEGPLGRYTGLDVVRLGAADVTRRQAISQLTLGKNVSDRLALEFLTEIAPQDAQKTVGGTYSITDNIQLKGFRTGSPRLGGIYQVSLSFEFEYR